MTAPAASTLDPRVLAWRSWLLAFAGFLLAAFAVLFGSLHAGEPDAVATSLLLLVYTSVACTFLPLPTAWIVLWAARSVNPWAVAGVAACGTCIANLHDYYIVNALCRLGRIRGVRQSKFHGDAARWFRRAPFLTLAGASFVPVPVDVVRLLAVSTDYPRRRYVLATFAGRMPRYLLLALLGWQLQLSNRAIALVAAATVMTGLVKGAMKLHERRGRQLEAVHRDS